VIYLGERCTEKKKHWYQHPFDEYELGIKRRVDSCAVLRALGVEGHYTCDWCEFPEPRLRLDGTKIS